MPYEDDHFSSEFHEYWSRQTEDRVEIAHSDSKFREAKDIEELRSMTKEAWSEELEEVGEILNLGLDEEPIDAIVKPKSAADIASIAGVVLLFFLLAAFAFIFFSSVVIRHSFVTRVSTRRE